MSSKNKKMIVRGMQRGTIASLLVNLIFTVYQTTALVNSQGKIQVDPLTLGGLLLIFVVGVVVTVPIAMSGSIWLIFYFDKNKLKGTQVFIRGALFGFYAAIVIWAVLILAYFYKGDLRIVLVQATFSSTVNAISAGLVALQLQKDLALIEFQKFG